jgi:hypothetical protein
MPESYMHTNQGGIKISIDTSAVKPIESLFSPALSIPLKYVLQAQVGTDLAYCHLYGCEAKLKFQGHVISVNTSFPDREMYPNQESAVMLEFPLDLSRVAKLEQLRIDDAEFSLNIMFRYAILADVKIGIMDKRIVSKFSWGNGDIQFTVSQSDWIDLLPGLGYKAFRLIEIPAANSIIGKEYAKSLAELDHASRYIVAGEFDKAVGHCRSALEPIRGLFPGIAKHVKAGLPTEWTEVVNNATLEWLTTMFKFQADLTSKTHHAPSIGHFSKQEAEAIYMLTVATISIGGKMEPIKKD